MSRGAGVPGANRTLRRLQRHPGAVIVLVDAANVVGSRPDGWWRDRAGATTRLLTAAGSLTGRSVTTPDGADGVVAEVVAVVEGRARDVAAPDGVRVRRAAGSGDDDIAAEAGALAAAGERVLVVTADRGLRARLPAGSEVAGPGWFRDLIGA